MNVKELLIIVCFALLSTWALEYFFFNKHKTESSAKIQSGQGYTIPKEQEPELLRPLNTEIDFLDVKRPSPAVVSEIATEYGNVFFSTDGACLDRIEYKRSQNGATQIITTVFPPSSVQKERRCFLVALEEQTPFYYTLVKRDDAADSATLVYQAETDQIALTKTFIISKKNYKIDLQLALTPKSDKKMAARVFFPMPLMPELKEADSYSALIVDEKNKLLKTASNKLEFNKAWFEPTLIGVENRYFVNAFVHDSDHFAQRAYFKSDNTMIFAIIESPLISQAHQYSMSFYMGPKEEKAMAAVDKRLEQALDYSGIFAPISRLLLLLLGFIFSFVKNYGLAIIILTIFIKLLLAPLSLKSMKSMKKTQDMQSKLQYLQQKYKHDPETLARERAELIRQHGMPGLAGCLPVLLQIPIFIALSRILSNSIQLYNAPFLWICDLSSADPYYLLPILIGIAMILQATTVDTKQRMQFIVMGLVFGVVSMSFSAGLSLYVFMSTILTVIQSMIQKKFNYA